MPEAKINVPPTKSNFFLERVLIKMVTKNIIIQRAQGLNPSRAAKIIVRTGKESFKISISPKIGILIIF